jgi:hypothetical protein
MNIARYISTAVAEEEVAALVQICVRGATRPVEE